MPLPVNNGYTETRGYDPAGRLTRVATTRATAPPALTVAQYDPTYDPVGNPKPPRFAPNADTVRAGRRYSVCVWNVGRCRAASRRTRGSAAAGG